MSEKTCSCLSVRDPHSTSCWHFLSLAPEELGCIRHEC